PGSRVTGYGLVSTAGNGLEYVDSGCIKTTEKATLPERLDMIFAGVTKVIEQFLPTELALEQIFMARNAKSALKLGHARGVAMVASVNQGLSVYEYEARKVKQAVVGTGAATKEQVQYMVAKLLNLEGSPQPDAADALAVAICHINTQHNVARLTGSAPTTGARLTEERTN
ncbi:MAG: crossover junction endodeoxyribonuclease RuvC, partial [Pseudomonadales bacterium]